MDKIPIDKRRDDSGWSYRGYLPHFDSSFVYQFVTYRLHDSLPAQVIETMQMDIRMKSLSARIRPEKYLDSGYGNCFLAKPEIANIVQTNLQYFHEKYYELVAWVIMPNHVHTLIRTSESTPLRKVIHSWKSYTALESNKLLGREGAFWYPDYWDRYIRNEEHFLKVIDYIHMNPVKAGLIEKPSDWKFSNASHASHSEKSDRKLLNLD